MANAINIIDQNDSQYGNGVNWNAVNQIVGAELQARKQQAQVELQARKEQERAEEEAVRYQGMQEYQKLIDGGATPEEAFRYAAPKLMHKNEKSMAGALRATAPRQFAPPRPRQPQVRTFADGSVNLVDPETGNSRPIGAARPAKAIPPAKPTPIPRQDWKIAETEYDDARANLKKVREMDEGNKKEIEAKDLAVQQAKLGVAKKLQALKDLGKTVGNDDSDKTASPDPKMLYEDVQDEPKYPEGKRLRNKSNGKIYVIKNGVPVEE